MIFRKLLNVTEGQTGINNDSNSDEKDKLSLGIKITNMSLKVRVS